MPEALSKHHPLSTLGCLLSITFGHTVKKKSFAHSGFSLGLDSMLDSSVSVEHLLGKEKKEKLCRGCRSSNSKISHLKRRKRLDMTASFIRKAGNFTMADTKP